MPVSAKPTIKGIFVNSHIKSLKDKKGDAAVEELAKRFGQSLKFNNSENVLVSDEVKIIELCLDLQAGKTITRDERAFEAGRLHFQNFVTTPLAKIIFPIFRSQFKLMMLNSGNIAGHVFQGVKFTSTELGSKSVQITMENNDYPLDHFKGLFFEWLQFSGLKGEVKATETTNHTYEYIMTWH